MAITVGTVVHARLSSPDDTANVEMQRYQSRIVRLRRTGRSTFRLATHRAEEQSCHPAGLEIPLGAVDHLRREVPEDDGPTRRLLGRPVDRTNFNIGLVAGGRENVGLILVEQTWIFLPWVATADLSCRRSESVDHRRRALQAGRQVLLGRTERPVRVVPDDHLAAVTGISRLRHERASRGSRPRGKRPFGGVPLPRAAVVYGPAPRFDLLLLTAVSASTRLR